MPRTNDICEMPGTFVDEHGHETAVEEGETFPECPEGQTFWWHEDLPVAKQMMWEAERPPRPGGLRRTW